MLSYQANSGRSELKKVARYAGIHLSGANTHKSAVIVLSGELATEPLVIEELFDRIGSMGRLFSDERLVEVLTHAGPFAEVFVDCPLSVPPCVACQRPVCPGTLKCEDLSVAYMMALATNKAKRKEHRRSRPINPQSQRLWDVMRLVEGESVNEPTYTANLAPLVTRARTLQRRLNSLVPQIALKETSVLFSLQALVDFLGIEPEVAQHYRNFESGLTNRKTIVEKLIDRDWLEVSDANDMDMITRSVENFHALVAGLVAAIHHAGYSLDKPINYLPQEGWVYLPSAESVDNAVNDDKA